MNKNLDLSKITSEINSFRDDRDWKKFHTIKNLSMALSVEASELMEIFQWASYDDLSNLVAEKELAISEEIADIFIYLLLIANEANIDIETAVFNKMAKNAKKYPIDKSKSCSKKYSEL
ncbi:nucleotide pyrophosphohydrolase [Thiosulfativibrio zosterae]|uniref:Pyrophosphatase n=1 Tax=Thiosulfativibrio zosterae TaxID=2675053 RepID=A0A6F8PNB5_9GAMM|nr:nucleotide pyrophosphohydrolase [Thiosulfativibrio zosterae]BBP43527.1 pyrophosphatase [Thiosulfativibrio zosterae]